MANEDRCGLDDLIEALTIFRKYAAPDYPTHCSHDQLTICGVEPDAVTPEDKARLRDLGFVEGSEGAFISFRFGGA